MILRRLLPHPLLTLGLTIIWCLLVNKITPGNVLLGFILGIIIPALTAPYWPDRPKVQNPMMAAEYIIIVLWDIVMANIAVAMIVLFKRDKNIHSQWVTVPLEVTSPTAITVLAGTITMTPGTVSAMLGADGRSILVHCLHTDDPDGVRDEIKNRYERRLKEVFE